MISIQLFQNDANKVPVKAGAVLFSEGEQGDTMYALIEGRVRISRHGKAVAVLEAGQIFGEMAVIDHSPRSATATAETDCVVVPINERRFLFLVQQTPFFGLQMLRLLAERLRAKLDS